MNNIFNLTCHLAISGQAYDMAPYWVVSKWFIAP